MDVFALVCLAFGVCTVISFGAVFYSQYTKLDNDTNRLIILSTRLALTLPLYATTVFISVVAPIFFPVMELLVAVILGYSFFVFLVLIVTNMGGAQQTLAILHHSNKTPPCACCFPADHVLFYNKVYFSVRGLLTTRIVIVLVSTFLQYVDSEEATLAGSVLQILAVIQLIRGVVSISNLCKMPHIAMYSPY